MSSKRRILIQLDTDPLPSAFDAVVAVDSGADVLLRYGGIRPEMVRDLVYGAIFTRGVDDLRSTAVFIGGGDVSLGERVLKAARESLLGPLKVSLMLDSGGANTTAAASVVAACRHLCRGDDDAATRPLAGRRAVILGATGSVGRRLVRLLARCGAVVVAGSRSADRAAKVVEEVSSAVPDAQLESHSTADHKALESALRGAELVVAAGGQGVRLLPRDARRGCPSLQAVIDLNAVPPEGIEGIEGTDAGGDRDGVVAYGAIGVGETKMRIHKACIASLFEVNDRVLDADEILDVARQIEGR